MPLLQFQEYHPRASAPRPCAVPLPVPLILFSQHGQAARNPTVPCIKQSLGVAWSSCTVVHLGFYLLVTQRVLGSLELQLQLCSLASPFLWYISHLASIAQHPPAVPLLLGGFPALCLYWNPLLSLTNTLHKIQPGACQSDSGGQGTKAAHQSHPKAHAYSQQHNPSLTKAPGSPLEPDGPSLQQPPSPRPLLLHIHPSFSSFMVQSVRLRGPGSPLSRPFPVRPPTHHHVSLGWLVLQTYQLSLYLGHRTEHYHPASCMPRATAIGHQIFPSSNRKTCSQGQTGLAGVTWAQSHTCDVAS